MSSVSSPSMKTPSATSRALPPRQRAWNAALAACPGDLDLPALVVEGTIPAALRGGRYLLNGPGWMEIGGRLVHPFDGHGYLRAVRFAEDGGAALRARFVRTPAYVAEARAGKLVHRGLATNPSGSWWRNMRAPGPRNVANTTVVPWAGKLLCGWEGGRPHALDPVTLDTLGEADFGGDLPPGALLAHMRVDPVARRIVGLSLGMGRHTSLTFREFDAAGRSVATKAVTVPSVLLAHDFVMTPRWYILAGNPLTIDFPAFLAAKLGAGTLLQAVKPDNAAAGTLHLIPRGREGGVRTITLDRPVFAIHLANAFDAGDDVVVDLCAFGAFSFGQEFGYQGQHAPLDPALPEQRAPQRLGRVHITAGADTATWADLTTLGCDFPRVAARHEGHDAPAVYVAARQEPGRSDPFDSVARIELGARGRGTTALWRAPADHFVGEPVFAPKPGGAPDEGWVLVVVYDGLGETSTLVVLESDRIEAGPVARVHMPLLPYGFHGEWEARRD
ncbi:MAG: carotenoid oxygenase family protein [Myxococcota bacterium]